MHARTSVLVLIYFIVLIGLMDMAVPEGYEKKQIGYYRVQYEHKILDFKSNLVDWVYHLAAHVQWVLISVLVLITFVNFKVFTWAFLITSVMDMADFIVTFNTVWWYSSFGPVTMNVVQALILSMALFVEICKRQTSL